MIQKVLKVQEGKVSCLGTVGPLGHVEKMTLGRVAHIQPFLRTLDWRSLFEGFGQDLLFLLLQGKSAKDVPSSWVGGGFACDSHPSVSPVSALCSRHHTQIQRSFIGKEDRDSCRGREDASFGKG